MSLSGTPYLQGSFTFHVAKNTNVIAILHHLNIWQTFGQHLANIWPTFGKHLANIWPTFGQHLQLRAEIIALAHSCCKLFPIMDGVSIMGKAIGLPIGNTTIQVLIHKDNAGAHVLA